MPSSVDTSQDGLRTTVKKRLFNEVFKSVNAKWKRRVVMVVDEESTRIISNVIGMYDLMENRVTLVDSLEKKRAPFLDMAVVYFVAPSESSVDALIADWQKAPLPRRAAGVPKLENNEDSNQANSKMKPNEKKQLYADAVFIYFLNRVSDELLNKIKACKPLVTRIRALSEVNIDFLAKEERAFHFDMKPSSVLRNLYRQRGSSDIQETISRKLVTLCATMNEYPHIRFKEESPVSYAIAMAFHTKMNEFIGASPSWWYHGDTKHTLRDRSTLLILDREFDTLSPFMHEFTYQAMANDLLKIKDDKVIYKADTLDQDGVTQTKTEKEVLLNDNDVLWTELRGKHIADVIQNLSTRIRDVVNSNSGAVYTKDSGKNLSISQMASALKSLPEYREVMSKLSQHMYISHQCMDLFNKQNLLDLSDLEQTLATGQDDEGRRPKLSELIEEVKKTLPNINAASKLRLLGILMVSQRKNIKPDALESLFQESGLKKEQTQILKNLTHLGVDLDESDPTSRTEMLGNMIRGTRLTSTAAVDSDSQYSSSRYVCSLKSILEDMTNDRLSIEMYPSVLPLPPGKSGTAASVRTRTTSRWARNETRKKKLFTGGRQMVFVAGGLCYAELRSAHEVMAKTDKEIILGSTGFVNPMEFIQGLKNCK